MSTENQDIDLPREFLDKSAIENALLKREGPLDWTPLMISCAKAPVDIVALICKAQTKACLIPDKSGSLPIHFCSTFRRDAFVEILLKLLCEFSPSSVEVKNAWGQTALHSLLDAKKIAPIGCIRVLLDQGQYTNQALQTRDKNYNLPLHIAACKKLPAEYIQALVEALRGACFETDRTGSLPCHILHTVTQGQADVKSIEALLIPLAIGSVRQRQNSFTNARPTSWAQLMSLSRQASKIQETQPPMATQSRTLAQDACRVKGLSQILPLHIAAHYGVRLEILKGICRQYPEAAKVKIPWPKITLDDSVHERHDSPMQAKETRSSLNGKHPSTIDEEEEGYESDPSDDESEETGNNQRKSNHIDTPKVGISINNIGEVEEEPWEEESLRTPSESEDEDIFGIEISNGKKAEQEFSREEAIEVCLCPLEIFERGRAFMEANNALSLQDTGELEDIKVDEILSNYMRRSDLLLAYYPGAQNQETSIRYLDDKNRLSRMENQIKKEASENGYLLSDSAALIWTYLTEYNDAAYPKKYIHSIGRILTSLEPCAIWKLCFVQLFDRDVFVTICCTGRTVAQEAEIRTPSTRMDHMLKFYWFQYLLTTFLDSIDALNYSMACRYTRAGGVRLLPQVPLRVTEATWKKAVNEKENSPPKPWQRIDVLVTQQCTHSIFISFYVEWKQSDESTTDDQCNENCCGGMLVVRDDNRKLRPDSMEPWGKAVVAYARTPTISGSLVRLSFQHTPGRSYGLWHYNHGPEGSILSVSDVRVRQLIHSCDSHGRSPLHLLLSSFVDQPANPMLNMQVSLLLAANFGSGDSVGDVPLHYALKCGVSEEVLTSIITASPSALMDTDKEGRTPMHAAFLLSRDEPPALGIIRALLTSPGENAIRLKDSHGRLPIHIAAERGAGEAILRMLIEAYPDGCYRQNKYGDLPLHLLVRNGTALTNTVELLLRPIMHNDTICKIPGAQGVNLPLHIAAEYQCSFKVLEKLLQTYGDAALIPRETNKSMMSKVHQAFEYALDIFEHGGKSLSADDSVQVKMPFQAKEAVSSADFALRSDLIFVYNPLLVNQTTGKPYRKDRERIRRLENMIKREASQCGEDRKINRLAKLSDMAQHGWIFLCTYSNGDDVSDNFAGAVRRILRGMSGSAVDVLAHAKNPKMSDMMIKDCATPVCRLLIMSRLRFVGRYVLYDEVHPVHKSESCLVMRAKDHGLEDEYRRIMTIYDAKEQHVDDDISDAGSEPPLLPSNNEPNEVTLEMFVKFAVMMGVRQDVAREEVLNLLSLERTKVESIENPMVSTVEGHGSICSGEELFSGDDETIDTKKRDPDDENALSVGKEVFTTFCRAHRLNSLGVRTVVIKFMKDVVQFRREIEVRASLNLSDTTWPVVPILDDYSVDRIDASRKKDIDIMSSRDDVAEDNISSAPENRDELYALDILEKNASVHNFALYKYAVVMPAGDRDLGEICQHEELGILQVREYMLQVGNALHSLHQAGKFVVPAIFFENLINSMVSGMIHGDLKMENVVRFGKNLALIDFDGAHKIHGNDYSEKMGGGSSKFCTGVLPPEMISKVDLISDYPRLIKYEDYWRRVSEDAKDINLLTPDDIQTISSVIKSLLAKADVARNLRKAMPRGLRDEMKNLYSGLENPNDWKDILSLSLITLSFDDLPYSLNRCREVDEFAKVWNRLLFHAKLWSKVKPRITNDEKFAFIIKTYNDLPDETGFIEEVDESSVPYAFVRPSEKIDVWSFGVLLFALCSGGSLFHLGFGGDLHDSEDFRELYDWNSQKAECLFREKVEDPIAQDLLVKILAPEDARLVDMSVVLRHPFFGPSSNSEAQHILERHEEEQLMIEETIVIKRMTNETRRKMEDSMERLCKIIYDMEKIVVPTCLIVLPYRLEEENYELKVKSERDLGLAVEIGYYMLEINRITATLSFFLMLKRCLGSGINQKSIFRSKFKDWTRSCKNKSLKEVSLIILSEIGCGVEYIGICIEMIKEGETQALKFLSNPLKEAHKLISQTIEAMMKCFEDVQDLYLVDEINGIPVKSDGIDDSNQLVYPMAIDRSSETFRKVLFPFVNIAVMKLTASSGLVGLAKLLCLPLSYGIPEKWKFVSSGLVHKPDKPSSIAEFAVLHEVMSRQEMISINGNLGQLSHNDVIRTGNEMSLLEDFFRENDPLRTFANLQRISDGKDNSPAIWSVESEVTRIQGEIELASAEHKLRELKKEWVKRQKMQEEIQLLTRQIEHIRGINIPHSDNMNSKEANDTRPGGKNDVMYSLNRSLESAPEGKNHQSKARKKSRFKSYFGIC
jgi:ankyrin repeat protein